MWEGYTLRTFYRVAQVRKCGAVPHRSLARTAVAGESFVMCQNYVCMYTCGWTFVYVHNSASFSHVSIISAVGRWHRQIRTVESGKENE
jgi:hypothetical protein